MLRHYTIPTHEPCQTSTHLLFFTTLFFILALNNVNIFAQNTDSFEIKLKGIEYIDDKTEAYTFIDANSTNTVLNLTRNYNHVFVALENDPSIQYSYKVTGETDLLQWKIQVRKFTWLV